MKEIRPEKVRLQPTGGSNESHTPAARVIDGGVQFAVDHAQRVREVRQRGHARGQQFERRVRALRVGRGRVDGGGVDAVLQLHLRLRWSHSAGRIHLKRIFLSHPCPHRLVLNTSFDATCYSVVGVQALPFSGER